MTCYEPEEKITTEQRKLTCFSSMMAESEISKVRIFSES